MGDTKKPKKKFERPKKPWEKNRIIEERKLINTYGFKNKKEIWRLNAMLRGFRAQARTLVALNTTQSKIESINLIKRLVRMGLLNEDAGFDDVLELTIDDISRRRLISMVIAKGLARTAKQARQFIVHKHILVNNKKVNAPNYLVLKNEQDSIQFAENSCLSDSKHPLIEAMQNISKEEVKLLEKIKKEEKKDSKKERIKEVKKEVSKGIKKETKKEVKTKEVKKNG